MSNQQIQPVGQAKYKLTRLLEKLGGEVGSAVNTRTANGDAVRSSKAFLDFYYGNLQWNTVSSYQKRLNRLIVEFPQFSDLADKLPEIVRVATEIATIVAADKARKQAKRDIPKPRELESGVKMPTAATYKDVGVLLGALGAERAAHIEAAAADAVRVLEYHISRLADSATVVSPDTFRRYGIYPHNDTEKCAEMLKSSETRARVISSARKDAAFDFDSFVVKLAGKIAGTKTGPVQSASLTGSTWVGSGLTVMTTEKQIWVTQRIINHSPLGRAFHQWPTIRKQ